LLVSSIEDEQPVWRLLSLKDGTMSPPMAERKTLEPPDRVPDHTSHDRWSARRPTPKSTSLRSHQRAGVAGDRACVSQRARALRVSLERLRQGDREVEGERDGFGYQLVDLTTHRAEALGDIYEGVGKPLEVRRITYAAGDGLMIRPT